MVPSDHGFGTSFAGISAYLLHDKRPDVANDHFVPAPDTDDRVAWTHCHNFGTQDAATAFRVMAAVAMDQPRLRERDHAAAQAALPEDERKPFRNTGRKSNAHVWHYSLSWHPDEADKLTKEHMIDTAVASLSMLGMDNPNKNRPAQYANEHQAVFVCHLEEDTAPHVHVVVNRVHPVHGRQLQAHNYWNRFSRWAQKYEQDHEHDRGRIFCKNRPINNALRDEQAAIKDPSKRVKIYYKNNLPHHVAKDPNGPRNASNNNQNPVAIAAEEQRQKTIELANDGRRQAHRHAAEARQLRLDYHAEMRAIRLEKIQEAKAAEGRELADYQEILALFKEQSDQEVDDFHKRQATLLGRIRNFGKAVQSRWQVQQSEQGEGFKLSAYYKMLADKHETLQAVQEGLALDETTLRRERDRRIAAHVSIIHGEAQQKRDKARQAYVDKRDALISAQKRQEADLQAEWRIRKEERAKALQDAQKPQKPRSAPPAKQEFEKVAEKPRVAAKSSTDTTGTDSPKTDAIRDKAKTAFERVKARNADKTRDRGRE